MSSNSHLREAKLFGIDRLDSLSDYAAKRIAEVRRFLSENIDLSIGCPLPLVLTVEPTNRCNLNCPLCPGRQTDRDGILDIGHFENLMKEIGPEIIKLNLYLNGEPLLHPKITEFVHIAKDNGVLQVNIHTNGLCLTEGVARDLVAADLDFISFSIDGISQRDYQLYRVGGDVEQALSKLALMVRVRNQLTFEKRPRIALQCLLFRHLIEKKETIRAHGLSLGVDEVVFKSVHGPKDPLFRELAPPQTGNNPRLKEPISCRRPFFHGVISCYGDMRLCCSDFHAGRISGNVFTDGFENLWRSEDMNALRRMLLNRQLPKKSCHKCPYFQFKTI